MCLADITLFVVLLCVITCSNVFSNVFPSLHVVIIYCILPSASIILLFVPDAVCLGASKIYTVSYIYSSLSLLYNLSRLPHGVLAATLHVPASVFPLNHTFVTEFPAPENFTRDSMWLVEDFLLLGFKIH